MWLPPEPPPEDLDELEPWRPANLGLDPEALVYIVVDELHDRIVGLVVSPWPRVDHCGRLRFGDETRSREVAAPVEDLSALLRTRQPVVNAPVDEAQVEALRTREVTIGDVFAARPRSDPVNGDPAVWLEPPILDLTAPAREMAKAQTSAARSGTMEAGFLEVVGKEAKERAGDGRQHRADR